MKVRLVCLVSTLAAAVGIVTLLALMQSSASAAPPAAVPDASPVACRQSSARSVRSIAAPDISPVTWTDNFDNPLLDSRWSWVREDPTHWSLTERPGFLRITAQYWETNKWARNLLLQTAPIGDYEIETHVFFTPTVNIQRAGLLIYEDDANYFLLSRAYCDIGTSGNGIYFDHVQEGQGIGWNHSLSTDVVGEAYLRLVRRGAVYTGYFSENGTDWQEVGVHTAICGFVPSRIGLWADVLPFWGGVEIPADFDYFRLDDHSYRMLLPLVVRD